MELSLPIPIRYQRSNIQLVTDRDRQRIDDFLLNIDDQLHQVVAVYAWIIETVHDTVPMRQVATTTYGLNWTLLTFLTQYTAAKGNAYKL